MKVNSTIDDIRLGSNLTIIKTLRFAKKSFIFTILGFTQSHLGPLGDIEGFVLLIPGSYKRNTPMEITGIHKTHLKCDCIHGSVLNNVRELFLFSSALFTRWA